MTDAASSPASHEYVKDCQCGRRYTKETWEFLPHAYDQTFAWGEVHEARHCVCGSTIVVVLSEGDPEEFDENREGSLWVEVTPHGFYVPETRERLFRAITELGYNAARDFRETAHGTWEIRGGMLAMLLCRLGHVRKIAL